MVAERKPMNAEELIELCKGLDWISEGLEGNPGAAKLRATFTIVQLTVTELAVHLSKGLELSEALRQTALGTLPLGQSTN